MNAFDEIDLQCKEEDEIHDAWADRGKSRRVRRKQNRKGHRDTDVDRGDLFSEVRIQRRKVSKQIADEQIRELSGNPG